MNERIKELAEQARDYADDCFGRFSKSSDVVGWNVLYNEKFAELIVRECAEVGSKFSQAHPLDIQYQIKRHFGVEE